MHRAITVRIDEAMKDKPREGSYTEITMSVIEEYAQWVGADMVYLTEPSECEVDDGKWHYRIMELYDLFDKYYRILNLDADVLINKTCPNLFDVVPYEMIGTILEDKGSRKYQRREVIKEIQNDYGSVGWEKGYINTGVFLTSRVHRDIFQKIEENFWTGFGYDDIHLGYNIHKQEHKIFEFDYKYNHMTMFSEKWNFSPNRFKSYIIHYAGSGIFENKWYMKDISREEQIRRDYNRIMFLDSLRRIKRQLLSPLKSLIRNDQRNLKVPNKINNLDNYYVFQKRGWGIGNFIMCTPTLKTLSDHFGVPVPVHFDDSHIEEMFIDCPFIKIINQENIFDREILFGSDLINEDIEDWQYIHQLVTTHLSIQFESIPQTYVDSCPKPGELGKRSCVIVRGAANDSWIPEKDPGDDIYKHILEQVSKEFKVVFIGATSDYERFIKSMKNWVEDPIIILDDMRKSLGAISGAEFVISNDTGMYHAAGALNKDVFVMWKKTLFTKNKSPGNNCKFSFPRHWKEDFDDWYNERRIMTNEMSSDRT
tara:strand:- start:1547 stop:3160 length:1614 start_codon:yes stop_codon:yes gene_type:complete